MCFKKMQCMCCQDDLLISLCCRALSSRCYCPLKWLGSLGSADYQRMSRCFLFVGIQAWRTSGRWPETQRQWVVSVIVCGSCREELSPAQTEPTNAISVSNTIVLFSRANAIIVSPVLRAHSHTNPRARHLDQLYALSLMWTKHTQSF